MTTGRPCHRAAAVAAISIAALTSSACSLLPKPEAQQTYALPAQSLTTAAAVSTQAATLPWSLRVQTPQAIAPLDSPRIIVRHPNASLASYRGIRWADRAPLLLRDRLVQFLGDSGVFRAVISDNAVLPADADLALTLRAFQLDMPADTDSGHARVAVRLDAQLIAQPIAQRGTQQAAQGIAASGPHLLAQHTFVQTHAVDEVRDPDAVIAAFGRAVDELVAELTPWLTRWLAQQTPPPGPGDTP